MTVDRLAAEMILRLAARGADPVPGQILIKADDGWKFGDIPSTPIPPVTLPKFHSVGIGENESYSPDFVHYQDFEFVLTGTPVQILNPVGIEEGQTYFFRFSIQVDLVQIRWGTDDASTVFWFPGGSGKLSQASGSVDHATFVARSTSVLDGVIVPLFAKPAGLQ